MQSLNNCTLSLKGAQGVLNEGDLGRPATHLGPKKRQTSNKKFCKAKNTQQGYFRLVRLGPRPCWSGFQITYMLGCEKPWWVSHQGGSLVIHPLLAFLPCLWARPLCWSASNQESTGLCWVLLRFEEVRPVHVKTAAPGWVSQNISHALPPLSATNPYFFNKENSLSTQSKA